MDLLKNFSATNLLYWKVRAALRTMMIKVIAKTSPFSANEFFIAIISKKIWWISWKKFDKCETLFKKRLHIWFTEAFNIFQFLNIWKIYDSTEKYILNHQTSFLILEILMKSSKEYQIDSPKRTLRPHLS